MAASSPSSSSSLKRFKKLKCYCSSIGVLGIALLVNTSRCNAFSTSSSPSLFASLSSSSSSSSQLNSSSSSSSSGSLDASDIKIVGLPGREQQVQSLPGMYVKSFRRWIVEEEKATIAENDDDNYNYNIDDGMTATPLLLKAVPIRGSGITLDSSLNCKDKEYDNNNETERGWVNPTSTNQLWWPRDLPKLQIRPMLNVLFRNGVLSYVSAGLDVRVPLFRGEDDATAATDGTTTTPPTTNTVSTWRNHGLNSQPIARQWTTLDIAMEKLFHVEGFIVFDCNDDKEENVRGSDDSQLKSRASRYDSLFPSLDAKDALQKVARFVAELDSSSPLALGFHIASIPMTKHWIDLPTKDDMMDGSNNLNKEKEEDDDETQVVAYKLVCIATSEPFASKLLDLDEDVLTITSSSVLEVDVSRIAPGGESKYLTKPYEDLYLSGKKKKKKKKK